MTSSWPGNANINDGASKVFASAIDGELAAERDRKASLEQRALAVVSTSGLLVSLLFGFVTVVRGSSDPTMPIGTRLLLAASLSLFVVAVLCSLLANKPRDYQPLGVESDLRKMVSEDLWRSSADDAAWSLSEFRVGEVDRWRDNNKAKADHLHRAIAAECSAVLLMAAAVVVLIFAN